MWRERFKEGRLPALWSRHRGRAPGEGVEKLEARIIDWTLHRKPADGSTHWSSRKLGSALGIDHMRVARVWAKAGLQPHRRRHYMVSDDPQFEKKAAAIIGLYLKPPAHAAVFCVDEKSAIQALDRLDPVLPLSPGGPNVTDLNTFATAPSLYAALNTATGEVLGKTANRHTSAEFVDFLGALVATQPAKTHIHIIADNLSTHKTAAVQAFLSAHPNVQLHYTPTYSSWLNQIEIWFSKSKETSSHVGSSTPRAISIAKSCATSAITTKQLSPSSGLTKTPAEEFDKPFTFICYTALVQTWSVEAARNFLMVLVFARPSNQIRFVAFLYPLFFISGIPALLYQVVWQRSLFTIYGTNTESATAVVAAFLLGLGLGAFAGGWATSRWATRLLIIYGIIEFVIGLYGLCLCRFSIG